MSKNIFPDEYTGGENFIQLFMTVLAENLNKIVRISWETKNRVILCDCHLMEN